MFLFRPDVSSVQFLSLQGFKVQEKAMDDDRFPSDKHVLSFILLYIII